MNTNIQNLTTIILTTTAKELNNYPQIINSSILDILENTYTYYEILIPILTLSEDDIEKIKKQYPFYIYCIEIKFIENDDLLNGGNKIILNKISGENFLTIDLNKKLSNSDINNINSNLIFDKFWLSKLLKKNKVNTNNIGNFTTTKKHQINKVQKNRELVSIIIPVFNNLHFTKVAIDSILKVSDTSFEIVVINNNSTDGTYEYLEDLRLNFRSQDKTGYCRDFKVINNSENKRFSIACNQGADISEGKFFLFLNNDTKVTEKYLSRFVDTFDNGNSNTNIGIVGAKLIYEDRSIQHCGVSFDEKKFPFHIFRGYDFSFSGANRPREFDTVTAAALMIRKEIFLEVKKFDEEYINCFEDIDLCQKVREKKYTILYNPNVVIYHYESKTPGRKDNENISGKILYKKWYEKIISNNETLYQLEKLTSVFLSKEQGSIIDYKDGGVQKFYEAGIDNLQNKKYHEAIMSFLKIYLLDPENMPHDILNYLITCFKEVGIREKVLFYENKLNPNNKKNIKKDKIEYTKDLSSIIIPVLNNLHYTKNAIAAILKNTDLNDYEIIVINNNSNDGTYEYLENLKKTNYSATNPYCKKIKTILNSAGKSFSGSNNQGANIAEGENLVLLNNDTLVEKDWLNEMLKTRAKNKDCEIVGSKLIYEDRTIQHAGVVFTKETNVPFHFLQFSHFDHPGVNIEREFNSVTAACMLIDHEIYDRVNGFDELYINGFEDIDLCFKVKQLGKKVFYSPKSVVTHFESKTPGRKDHFTHGLTLLSNRWKELIINLNDAKDLYNEFNLDLKVDNIKRRIDIDLLGDMNINRTINEAIEIDFIQDKNYLKVIERLKPIYLLNPNIENKKVKEYLGLAYKYTCNSEKSEFFLNI